MTTTRITRPVYQTGTVTPGHVSSWTTDGVSQDAGTPADPKITGGIGILSSNQTSFRVSSSLVSGPFASIGLGVTNTTANLTVSQQGGHARVPFDINVGGTSAAGGIRMFSNDGTDVLGAFYPVLDATVGPAWAGGHGTRAPQIGTTGTIGNLLLGGTGMTGSGTLTTTATTGFVQIPVTDGPPTGTPETVGGCVLVFDQTNLALYAYAGNAAWVGASFSGSPTAGVTSFNGRTGVVTLQESDYANLDLSTLPTSDPTGGKPWLNGGVQQVGP